MLMLGAGAICVHYFIRLLMTCARLWLCCVLYICLLKFSLPSFHVDLLPWTNVLEYDPSEYVRLLVELLLRQPFLLFKMTSRKLPAAASYVQARLCQIVGVEAAVHAVQSSFLQDDTKGVLLLNASIAFNYLNRKLALHNIHQICPALLPFWLTHTGLLLLCTLWVKCYSLRKAGPLAMPMYALATLPLIIQISAWMK